MKQDIYGHKDRYTNWKAHALQHGVDDLNKKNSDILKQFIFDMEVGANVSNTSKKGARSYHRLNCVRQKLTQIFRMLEDRNVKDITKITEPQLVAFFDDMRKGIIQTAKGTTYKATADYVKGFKSFWHWHIKVQRKKGITTADLTEDIDSSREEKPVWVYLNEKQINQTLRKSNSRFTPLLEFLFDSGARPQEAFSLIGRNISQERGEVYCDIPSEVSKSIGRKIKLKLCGKSLLKHIEENKIGENDLLFPLSAPMVNNHLNELGKELFGEGVSKGGEKYCNLSMYDLRHCSCCFWLQRYKTTSLLMYRFGWKSERYVHYYSEFLGMKDEIKDEDMYVDITKTELEKQVIEQQKQLDKIQKYVEEQRKAEELYSLLSECNNLEELKQKAKELKLEGKNHYL